MSNTILLENFPPGIPDTPFQRAVRDAYIAETDPVLRAYLISIACRAVKSEHYARYEMTRYLQEKASPSGDWNWRWLAEVAACGGNAQVAFYRRWRITVQTFTDAESARRLSAIRRCAETTPTWAARELDSFWAGQVHSEGATENE